jgi:hypothetical protein
MMKVAAAYGLLRRVFGPLEACDRQLLCRVMRIVGDLMQGMAEMECFRSWTGGNVLSKHSGIVGAHSAESDCDEDQGISLHWTGSCVCASCSV